MICRPVSFHCWLSSSKTILINFTVTKKKKTQKITNRKKQRRTKRPRFLTTVVNTTILCFACFDLHSEFTELCWGFGIWTFLRPVLCLTILGPFHLLLVPACCLESSLGVYFCYYHLKLTQKTGCITARCILHEWKYYFFSFYKIRINGAIFTAIRKET